MTVRSQGADLGDLAANLGMSLGRVLEIEASFIVRLCAPCLLAKPLIICFFQMASIAILQESELYDVPLRCVKPKFETYDS